MKNLLLIFLVGLSTMCFSQWNLILNNAGSVVMSSDGTGYSYTNQFISGGAGYNVNVSKTSNDWYGSSTVFSGQIGGFVTPACMISDMTFLNDTLGFFMATSLTSHRSLMGTLNSCSAFQPYSTYIVYSQEYYHFLRYDLGYLNIGSSLLKISNTTTLSTHSIPTISAIKKIHFTDDSTGFILGVDSNGINRILRTDNSGASFNSPLSTGSLNLNHIYFPSSNTGYICCDSGIVYKTTDAGLSWSRITVPTAGALYAISFISNQIGFVGGENGSIFKTSDGGLIWQAENTGIGSKVIELFFFQNGAAYAKTLSKQLFKNSQSTGLPALNYEGGDILIYPNPFHDNLVIYLKQTSTEATVTVSNYLGQVLFAKTVNGQKTELNLSAFADGVYFVTLSTPDQTITKKLVKQGL